MEAASSDCLLPFWSPPLIQTVLLCVISQNCTHPSTCQVIKISLMYVNTNLYKLQIFGPFYGITDNQRLITSSSLRTSWMDENIKGFLFEGDFCVCICCQLHFTQEMIRYLFSGIQNNMIMDTLSTDVCPWV